MVEKDNRRFSRVQFFIGAELKADSKDYAVQIIDLSLNGVMIEVPYDCHLEIEQDCTLTIPLNNGELIVEMAAYIKHIKDNKVGLSIHHIDLESIQHLKRIIELNLGDCSSLDRELDELIKLNS